jgi:hypothetical protein
MGLTVLVSLLLALSRVFQLLGPVQGVAILIVLFILILQLVLATVTLVWATLGDGRVIVRFPIMYLTVIVVGALFPYYTGSSREDLLLWTTLAAAVAAYAAASLLVVRSCGYRITALKS